MSMSEKYMSRKPLKATEPEMRSEYDFSGAVRGKYYKRYLETSNVVVLEPDVARRFKNAASVNKALRTYLKGSKRGLTAGSTATARKRAAR
jgi:hypothetical protein